MENTFQYRITAYRKQLLVYLFHPSPAYHQIHKNNYDMKQILGKYMPQGEALLAGIHAISKETNIRQVFEKCVYMEDRIVPDERGGIIALTYTAINSRNKFLLFDISESH